MKNILFLGPFEEHNFALRVLLSRINESDQCIVVSLGYNAEEDKATQFSAAGQMVINVPLFHTWNDIIKLKTTSQLAFCKSLLSFLKLEKIFTQDENRRFFFQDRHLSFFADFIQKNISGEIVNCFNTFSWEQEKKIVVFAKKSYQVNRMAEVRYPSKTIENIREASEALALNRSAVIIVNSLKRKAQLLMLYPELKDKILVEGQLTEKRTRRNVRNKKSDLGIDNEKKIILLNTNALTPNGGKMINTIGQTLNRRGNIFQIIVTGVFDVSKLLRFVNKNLYGKLIFIPYQIGKSQRSLITISDIVIQLPHIDDKSGFAQLSVEEGKSTILPEGFKLKFPDHMSKKLHFIPFIKIDQEYELNGKKIANSVTELME